MVNRITKTASLFNFRLTKAVTMGVYEDIFSLYHDPFNNGTYPNFGNGSSRETQKLLSHTAKDMIYS